MTEEKPSQWQLYLVRCNDGSLYTGIATDAERRFAEHEIQGAKCAKYLRGKAPLQLVYVAPAGDRAQASRWEYCVKKLSKTQKEALVSGHTQLQELMEPAE